MKKVVAFLAICLISINISDVSAGNKGQKPKLTYTNPIINKYLADPYIKYDKGYYYLFATGEAQDGRFVPIYRSKNLVKWEFVRGAVSGSAKTDWNYKHFWAPEVLKVKGKYYLYYTASPENSPQNSGNRIGVAISDKIEGPYVNQGVLVPNAAIDGHPVFDKDGTLYMFYTIEWLNSKGYKAGHIYVDKMLSPTKMADKPIQILGNHKWQEGPFIMQSKAKYILTYSLGNWTDSTYHMRYATADKLTGPYAEQPDTIMKTNEMVKGPGHHSFFKDSKGKDWIVYHAWDTAHTARYPRIDRIFVKDNKITSDGATYTPQSVDK